MSYLAIARKWRPQRFEDLVGQGHVTRTLQNAIRMGRVHHAFLFTGARGVGKTSAARILAKALQCENGPADNPCNECGACREITAGSHPDVVEIDAASNNRVDDVRDLIEKVRYLPARGRRRIYIVDEVHMVTTQAFNALLKTLEEPPPHVVFIFATTDPQKILDTVLSRCQRFDFKMIPVRTIHERLKEICATDGVRITDGALLLVAREAGGSMRDAQSLLDQVLSFGEGELTEEQVVQTLGFIDRTLLHDVIEAVVVGDPARALDGVRRVQEFGYDARQFAKELLEALRHLMVIALVPDASRLVDLPADEQQRLKALAAGTTPEAIQRRFDLLAGALDDIARSETPGMILEVSVLRLARVRPYVPVEALVERLVALERRLAS
ncbi:MAG: DNA polymerase III subunit gamma/tau, partial [Phycisphaerales bacterium]|nr:DNA polymerase III subunit gamma/tau [Phycisphaerales bacterium]